MIVGVVETDTVWQDERANRERIAGSVPECDLAVFPKFSFSGFTLEPRGDGAAEGFLEELSRRTGTHLVAGYVGEGPANVATAVSPTGVQARYEKLHPFTFTGEDRAYKRGDALPVFELLGFSAAMFICYDLRFPEVFREAALQGADLFVVIANWPEQRAAHWHTLLKARAIENQAFVVGVNRVGEDPNLRYAGGSLVVAPSGDILLEGPGAVSIRPEAAAELRKRFPVLDDVRRDRYGWTR